MLHLGLSAVIMFAMVLVAGFFFDRKRRRDMEARPRITQAEVQAVLDWMGAEELRLPPVKLLPRTDRVPGPLQSRIGGAPWGRSASDWPRDERDTPLRFIAQLNFAEMPPLPGYPTQGLLQFFVHTDSDENTWKGREGEPHLLRWIDRPSGGEVLITPPEHLGRRTFPFSSEVARGVGLALDYEPDSLRPSPYAEPVRGIIPDTDERLPENAKVAELLQRIDEMDTKLQEAYGDHWIGGHPSFIQYDVRNDAGLADLDRVLLHLGPDEHVSIGDSGVLNFLIRVEDLEARRFEKAVFTYDSF
jgi:uncharacterized protein YneF (UPF0154 family)